MRSLGLVLLIAWFATARAQDTLAYSVELDDAVVTGQPVPTAPDEAVRAVRVIDRRELRGRGFTRLDEVLAREPTLAVSADPILGGGLSVGGLGGQNVQVLIDGMPVTGRLGGAVDLGQIDLSRVARIEIVPGATSARYGSNASGGVVNLITRREQDGKASGEVRTQGESAGLRQGSAFAGLRLGEWQLGGGVDGLRTDFGPAEELRIRDEVRLPDGTSVRTPRTPWNPKTQTGYRAELAWRPGDSLYVAYRHRGFTETLDLLGEVRRPEFRPYVVDQGFRTERRDHQLEANGWLGERTYFQATAGHNAFDRYKTTTRTDLEPDSASAVPGGADTTRYTATLLRASATRAFSPAWRLEVGAEYLRETAAGGRIRDTLTGERAPAIANVAAWLELGFTPAGAFSASATLRGGRNDRYDHPLVPALQLRYGLAADWTLRAGYSASFRAPSVQELFFEFVDLNHYIIGDPGLGAERGHHLEASATHRRRLGDAGAEVELGLRAFTNRLRDRITLFEFETARFRYANLERYATRGLAATASLGGLPRWTARLSGSYLQLANDLRDAAAAGGVALDRWTGSAEAAALVGYRVPRAEVEVRADYRAFGEQVRFVDLGGGAYGEQLTAGYHLLNLTASRALWAGRIELTAGVKDVFDVASVAVTGASAAGAHQGGPGQRLVGFGRNYFAGALVSF